MGGSLSSTQEEFYKVTVTLAMRPRRMAVSFLSGGRIRCIGLDGKNEVPLKTAAGEIVDAQLVVRAADWHVLEQRFTVAATDSPQSFRVVETAWNVNPLTEEMGRRCLVARRLLERGVRFVQLWSGADNGFPRRNWDSHEHLAKDHWEMAVAIDKPIAALMKDLKARGLFDDTIVHWTTEFGRMPCSQGSKGRDHNPFGYTNWLAGGGVKGGASYGATDEYGMRAQDNKVHIHDFHATILHLLGFDHTRLTFRHNGVARRLTDVHGQVLQPILS